ncbi:MAG: translational GTPase TypA [Desulfurella sp.]|jgi:GTP-binding protein|uniref:translational GTPase TypA n=1 Tax=Desulfurella TaxID=33001 RepID=UPI0003E0AB11|nr:MULTISPECIES: translational GTPase TypA [Desulfurella]AHF97440.1 GTP-binding protein [Desulfurella acetivorans A63]PMP65348.1 MAG: translational GTPase TypA [Desulfurella multipotens]PMP92111.1 MAG: translational GTPase TypA [Desulfurella sp.]HEX13890.1 translational GTPase TypA [Desulfurella acetivorans]
MTKNFNDNIRNIAIIAHVDHGKTTLVDAMFKQCGTFRQNQNIQERILDSMELEKERGITIAAKNSCVFWNGVKINILDTPGHSDFGGEVERALSMVDGAILLVDAAEGPLPQTRFVLKKALESKLKIIVVINKIDRQDARINKVLDEIYDLFIDLDANDEQLEFSVLYAIGKQGIAKKNPDSNENDLSVLFEEIINQIPPPIYTSKESFSMLVSDLGYSDYLGKLAIGKVFNGFLDSVKGRAFSYFNSNNTKKTASISKIQTYDGIILKPIESIQAGDIIVVSGIEDIAIGDTICTSDVEKPLKRIVIDEPVVSMVFSVNDSPFAGKDGKIVQSRNIKERLIKETLKNVSIKFEETEDTDKFIVKGRGEFQMVILIEQLRREGFEFCVSRPQIIYKFENGKKLEPYEHLFIDCAEEFMGIITQKIQTRKGKMINLSNNFKGRIRIEFLVPSRSLIGFRDEFLTDTKGTGIMNSYLEKYDIYAGDIATRYSGSLVSDRQGISIAYALFNLQPRGQLFIGPNEPVYEGMIIGEHNKEVDLNVNPCKEKKLSNMRAAGKDDNIILSSPNVMTLEKAINFIKDDEMVEVTPLSIRLRKTELSAQKRKVLSHTHEQD